MFSILATLPATTAIAVTLLGPPVLVLVTVFGLSEGVRVVRFARARGR
ncbi:hypothetical protein [Methylobacterium haplocladii]|uniref:Uncharacterized protein n=1 Tax=Methylobacterium haplocladii TaxID=1176176 RepID=A0A512ISA8_9HYPH|nr:hypothetical protein [Methylobacterium haplocladii]GEP00571.1 hypothetical protein MHA02_29580 [Methylobacterium haplocladii]GJD85486.1 hypothetical protein HPGCJGGD_3375 [Methylobacterium haplocladii]GLS57719.1 hypothetical protein GCM10007887_03750 [Methylobacterium haplocladii]